MGRPMDEHLEHAGDDKPLDKRRWRTPVLIVAEVDETAAKFPNEEGLGAGMGPAS